MFWETVFGRNFEDSTFDCDNTIWELFWEFRGVKEFWERGFGEEDSPFSILEIGRGTILEGLGPRKHGSSGGGGFRVA